MAPPVKPKKRTTDKGIIRAARVAMERDYRIWGQCSNAGRLLLYCQVGDEEQTILDRWPVRQDSEGREIQESVTPTNPEAVCWCAQGLLVWCDARFTAQDHVNRPRESIRVAMNKASLELYPKLKTLDGGYNWEDPEADAYVYINDGHVHKTWRGAYNAMVRVMKRAEELV